MPNKKVKTLNLDMFGKMSTIVTTMSVLLPRHFQTHHIVIHINMTPYANLMHIAFKVTIFVIPNNINERHISREGIPALC